MEEYNVCKVWEQMCDIGRLYIREILCEWRDKCEQTFLEKENVNHSLNFCVLSEF